MTCGRIMSLNARTRHHLSKMETSVKSVGAKPPRTSNPRTLVRKRREPDRCLPHSYGRVPGCPAAAMVPRRPRRKDAIRIRARLSVFTLTKRLRSFYLLTCPRTLIQRLLEPAMVMMVPRFLLHFQGEYPAFIRQPFGPPPQRIRPASSSQAMCEAGSRCSLVAKPRSWPGRRPATRPSGRSGTRREGGR